MMISELKLQFEDEQQNIYKYEFGTHFKKNEQLQKVRLSEKQIIALKETLEQQLIGYFNDPTDV